MYALLKHPLVDCDFEEAALTYALRDPSLADRFIDLAETVLRGIAQDPWRYRERFGGIRRVNLHAFPHAIFYFVKGESVYVLALLHGARDHESVLARRRAAFSTAGDP